MTLGNGVVENHSLNNRLQQCEFQVTSPASPGSSTMLTVLHKQYFFNATSGERKADRCDDGSRDHERRGKPFPLYLFCFLPWVTTSYCLLNPP
jgi:hypothetical protein